MNIKRIFGSVLTVLGILGLIYASIMFVNSSNTGSKDTKGLIVYGILGIVFFAAGLSLIRSTKDEA